MLRRPKYFRRGLSQESADASSEFFKAPCAARKCGAGRFAFVLLKMCGCAAGSAAVFFDAVLSDKGLCSAKAVFCAATKEGGKDKMIFAVKKGGKSF